VASVTPGTALPEANGPDPDCPDPDGAVGPGRPAGRPRSADADEAILAAARELLAERGWDGMTLGDVAARAGVAKTTLYRRWPGKAELVVDAMAQVFDTLCPVDAGSVRADAEAAIRELVALLSRPETQTAFLALAAHASRDPKLRAAVCEKIVDRQRRLVYAGAARAAARGDASQIPDPDLFFDVIAGTMVHRLLIVGEPVDDGYLGRFLDLLVPTGPR
jgi:AcrR family transcriptional regulator